jgi:hypothetical protein
MAEREDEFRSVIMKVIKKGVPAHQARLDGSLPLHLLLSGPQPVPRDLLDIMIGANPNDVDGKGNNYLMCLLFSRRLAPTKKVIALDLIKFGVDPFHKNNVGICYYHQLVTTDPESALQITPRIDDLKKMNEVHYSISGCRTVHFAIIGGDINLVKTLIERGASFSDQTGNVSFNVADRQFTGNGLNCMHIAALYGLTDILEHILDTSTLPIDCLHGEGGTALQLATFSDSEDCINLLLSHGTRVKPLHEDEDIKDDCVKFDTSAVGLIEAAELRDRHQTDKRDNYHRELLGAQKMQEVCASDLPFRSGLEQN